MTVPNPWLREIWQALAMIGGGWLVGLALGYGSPGLIAGLLGYLAWQIHHLRRLEVWLRNKKGVAAPESVGAWGELYSLIHQLVRSNRKRKRKLKNYLKRYRESTAAMPDAVVLLAGGNEIEWWNDAADELLGLRSPHDVGQPITNLLREPALVRTLQGAEFGDAVEMAGPVDESKRLAVRVIAYGKNSRLLLVRDITRLHHMERVRQDFVANVSHELRTPLTVLGGYLEALAEQGADGERWQQPVEEMRRQTQRMQRIVEDLLFLARLDSERPLDMGPVDAPRLVREAIEEARRVAGAEAHQWTVEVDDECWISGAESALHSAFANLLSNAARYTRPGGHIRVRWGRIHEQPCFEVRDDGVGIPARHLERITERFYRVNADRSRSTGGTGLGLAIVRHVLERHEAALEVESVPGRGSTFRCRFPAQRLIAPQPGALHPVTKASST